MKSDAHYCVIYLRSLFLKQGEDLEASTIGSVTSSRGCSTAFAQYPLKGTSGAKAMPSCLNAKASRLLTEE